MNKILAALVCGFACTAMAQTGGDYFGPGVMSNGAGTIGQRSGAQLNLRVFADVTGVYDNGIVPFALNSAGQVATINGLYGEQFDLGVYGQHAWRQATLGLDLRGNYYHYDNEPRYDGSGDFLNLGYTYQKSRRLLFDLHGVGGTTSIGNGSPGFFENPAQGAVVGQQSAILFDNRIYYLQASGDLTYLLSARTSISLGGSGYEARYQAAGLVGMQGYTAQGRILHRLSRVTTVGVMYQHQSYQYVRAYGNSAIDGAELFYATEFNKRWVFSVAAGVFQAQTQGIEQVTLNPVVAALLGGQLFGTQTFNSTHYDPSGDVRLMRKLKQAEVSLFYSKTVVPGNGVYLASRQDSGGASYSFTAKRKWNFGVTGAYYRLDSLGQGLTPYSTFGGGAGFTYNLGKALHLVGRYDYRRQDISTFAFRRDASHVTAGLAWSPGDLPLSLW